MFTGIIAYKGAILTKSSKRLSVKANRALIDQLSLGDSVSVNGACLTVTKILVKEAFEVDVMPETFKKTMLGKLKVGSPVNLELALRADGRFDGHIVQGHVDSVAIIKSIKKMGNSRIVTFSASKDILGNMVEKGSVAINGISLTLIDVTDKIFTVGIIPHTWDNTTLKSAKAGDLVNIELDILAKYIEKYLANKFLKH